MLNFVAVCGNSFAVLTGKARPLCSPPTTSKKQNSFRATSPLSIKAWLLSTSRPKTFSPKTLERSWRTSSLRSLGVRPHQFYEKCRTRWVRNNGEEGFLPHCTHLDA